MTSMPRTPSVHHRVSALSARPWAGVASRSLAAIVGGYAIAAAAATLLALVLPATRSEAVLIGMLAGIVVCACAALWAFAARTALRAWLGIAMPTAAMALACWGLA